VSLDRPELMSDYRYGMCIAAYLFYAVDRLFFEVVLACKIDVVADQIRYQRDDGVVHVGFYWCRSDGS